MTTLPTFQDAFERSVWVQAQLRLAGSSFAQIARENGWSRNAVTQAMRSPSDPQEKAIADKLGVTQRQLFPERYDRSGQRRHHVHQNRRGSGADQCKTDEAA